MDSMSDQSIDSSNLNLINKYCKYLNRKVVLKTTKSSHIGSLKCIDPLTQTIALIVTDLVSNTSKVVIAMSHSIKSIELLEDNSHINDSTIDLNQFLSKSLSEQNSKTLSDEELNERKQNVIKWLQKNRIPCEQLEDGSLCIAYALTLRAPYGSQQCICGNEIVLHQIQTLLDSMPTQEPNQT